MATKLVETVLPAHCNWCRLPLHVFLDVQAPTAEAAGSLILCPGCDGATMSLVRDRVVGFGRLERRKDVLVWVPGRNSQARKEIPRGREVT